MAKITANTLNFIEENIENSPFVKVYGTWNSATQSGTLSKTLTEINEYLNNGKIVFLYLPLDGENKCVISYVPGVVLTDGIISKYSPSYDIILSGSNYNVRNDTLVLQ